MLGWGMNASICTPPKTRLNCMNTKPYKPLSGVTAPPLRKMEDKTAHLSFCSSNSQELAWLLHFRSWAASQIELGRDTWDFGGSPCCTGLELALNNIGCCLATAEVDCVAFHQSSVSLNKKKKKKRAEVSGEIVLVFFFKMHLEP